MQTEVKNRINTGRQHEVTGRARAKQASKQAPKRRKHTVPTEIMFTPYRDDDTIYPRIDYNWDTETPEWERDYPSILAFKCGIVGRRTHGVRVKIHDGKQLAKDNARDGGRGRQVDFQILLRAHRHTVAPSNTMLPGVRYILVSQSAQVISVRWLFLAEGEHVTTVSEERRGWHARREHASPDIAAIIEKAIASFM